MSRARTFHMGVLVLALLAVAGMLCAAQESNNALESTATVANVAFTGAKQDVQWVSSCTNAVWVRVWAGNETVAAITTASSGAFKVAAGESMKWTWKSQDGGIGFTSFSHITAAGATCETYGTFYYCPDCTVAAPCAGSGTGALAKRLAGAWVCN